MSKIDRSVLLRTPEDLERKYLTKIGELQKNYELQKLGLNKVENELNDFANQVTKDITDLQNQTDGQISTWFESGVPTLENYPASEWTTEEIKKQHLADIYYDKETGYAYRFIQNVNNFEWQLLEDNAITQALAIANSAKDTADRKRQVFINQPSPPYDVGDIWIKNQELYRCQTTKSSLETFEDNDWIIATKYTDDTVANQVGQNLTILSGTVTEIINDVDELSQTMTNTTQLVNEQGEKVGDLEIKTSQTSQSVDEIFASVSDITTNLDENYYSGKKIDELILNVKNGLTNNYSVGGGNNIFRNTGLFFENSEYTSGYEFWEGSVKRKNNMDSKSQTSMLLQNSSLKQSQTVPNDIYTVSFKFIKLNPLANLNIIINEVEYSLDDADYFIKTIEVQTREITIEFVCDTVDGYEIYELMVNYGEIALTYSQNANETKTDTVEISEGIKIISTATDSVFKANADGIRTEDKLGNVTTEFLDTGMKTNKLQATQGIISNLLIEDVDGQVWLTGLGR